MSVHRCVCYQHSFRRLRRMADEAGWTRVAEISNATGCGCGCGGCVPYLRAMLESGHTSFAIRQPGEAPEPVPLDPWDIVDDC